MSDKGQFHPNNMRKRFHQLTGEIAAIEAGSMPIRTERDALVQAHEATRKALDARIKKAEVGLFDLKQEYAMIARSLGGKTGKPGE